MSIFVFGSNESGIHGAGAAYYARKNHGAIYGVGFGRQGNSFAIPTKDWSIETLPYEAVEAYVKRFLAYAKQSAEIFHLTKIGCGLAGMSETRISGMFHTAPDNVLLINDDGSIRCKASEWWSVLK